MIEVGKINYLKVNRKTDIGYLLEDETKNNVVLHFNDTDFEEVIPGTYINVFIYIDSKGRQSATLQKPIITLEQEGLLKVESLTRLGAFVNNGIHKDVLVHSRYLPLDAEKLPKKDDYLLVSLHFDGYLYAVPLLEPHVPELKKLAIGDEVIGWVIKLDEAGIRVCSENFNTIFVYKHLTRGPHRLGQRVGITITGLTPTGNYTGKTVENKEFMINDDCSLIITYLVNHNRELPLDSESTSSEVWSILHISRKAFKRSLGYLYRHGNVSFHDGKTILNPGGENV